MGKPPNPRRRRRSRLAVGLATAVLLLSNAATPASAVKAASMRPATPLGSNPTNGQPPIVLASTGGFALGGRVLVSPTNPSSTLSCDHGYLEYFVPWRPRATTLVMWHSSAAQVWQNRWDGGPGYKDLFLRRDYPVFLWDGPRVGRANWGCDRTPEYVPAVGRDQSNFAGWNFGPRAGDWWPDVQFPTLDGFAWDQAARARYVEFDSAANVELQADAAATAADSGRLGSNIVYLTNSAAGLRAQLAAARSISGNVRGIVAYESMGYVFPEGVNVTGMPRAQGRGGFGPFFVPEEQFKRLAQLAAIQFVWGDHRSANYSYVQQSRLVASLINSYGGNAKVVMLATDAGLTGSTHIPFADMDNERVGDQLQRFLEDNGLDGYADGK